MRTPRASRKGALTQPCWSTGRHQETRRRWYACSSGDEGDGGSGEGEGEEVQGGEESDGEGNEGEGEEETSEDNELGLEMLPIPRHHAIAPVNIPDLFPEVPVLPIPRNPLFPRFVKMLEVRARHACVTVTIGVTHFYRANFENSLNVHVLALQNLASLGSAAPN